MSYHFLDDSGVATLWAAIKAKFIDVTKKGAANGVCPLNAYGVIPGEYIPGGGDEDRYVVNATADIDGTNPTADMNELKEMANHDYPVLRVFLGSNQSSMIAELAGKLGDIYQFSVLIGRISYLYGVNTVAGTITLIGTDRIPDSADDYIVASGSPDGWTWRKWNSGLLEQSGRVTVSVTTDGWKEWKEETGPSTGLFYKLIDLGEFPERFIESAHVHIFGSLYGGRSLLLPITYSGATGKITSEILRINAVSGDISINVHATGRWK